MSAPLTLADITGTLVPGAKKRRVIVLTRAMTYHGEVVEVTADAITVRCGCTDTHTIPTAAIKSLTEVTA